MKRMIAARIQSGLGWPLTAGIGSALGLAFGIGFDLDTVVLSIGMGVFGMISAGLVHRRMRSRIGNRKGQPLTRALVTYSLAAILIAVPIAGLSSAVSATRIDRQNCQRVSEAFVRSLMENDAKTAKLLTVPDQWLRIDGWMKQHRSFVCPFSINLDSEQMAGFCPIDEGNRQTCYFRYHCQLEGYSLDVDDIILEKTEAGYQIIGWGQVCEKRGSGSTECDIDR